MSTLKFNGVEIPIKLTYKAAMFDLPEKGLNILQIFQDEQTISNILANDRVLIDVLFYFAKAHTSTFEKMVEDLTPEVLNEFREVLWNEIVNFTNPQMRPALKEYMSLIKKELASPGEKLKRALSESSEEPE